MDIGNTRSGTIVEYKPNQTIEVFLYEFVSLSDADKFDVYSMYQWLVVRSKRKYGKDSDDYFWWEERLLRIADRLNKKVMEKKAGQS